MRGAVRGLNNKALARNIYLVKVEGTHWGFFNIGKDHQSILLSWSLGAAIHLAVV